LRPLLVSILYYNNYRYKKGDIMYLDETILQSKTTLSLVEFIEKVWKHVEEPIDPKLIRDYHTIINTAKKAKKKRSF
jgi:hypothetical protein